MVQFALKQDGVSDEGLRLMEQLNAASPLRGGRASGIPQESASLLARRFAPDRIRQRPAEADPLPPRPSAPVGSTVERRQLAIPVLVSLVSATALVGGMLWLGGIGNFDLDRVFQDAGLVQQPAPVPYAAAALSIDVFPPRPSVQTQGSDGDGKIRAATQPEVAPPLASGFAVRTGEADRIESLMAHGQKMIDVGYLAGARAYYRRAAEAGSGEAALAVGATFDPDVIARLGVQGIRPDRTEAAEWYARAAGLGIVDRQNTLRRLTESWGKEPAAAKESEIMADATPAGEISGPLRKPGSGSQPAQTAQAEPPRQQVASNRRAANAARPQLLASDEDPQAGPISKFVRAAAGLSAQEKWMEVASAVNIRKRPSSDAPTDKVALKGTKFRVLGREGNWVKVADPKTAQEGYIYNRFLTETSAP